MMVQLGRRAAFWTGWALPPLSSQQSHWPLFLTQQATWPSVQPDYTVIAMKYETVHTLITQLAYVFCMEYNTLSSISLHSTARYCLSQPSSPLLSSRHGDGGFSCVSPTIPEQQLWLNFSPQVQNQQLGSSTLQATVNKDQSARQSDYYVGSHCGGRQF